MRTAVKKGDISFNVWDTEEAREAGCSFPVFPDDEDNLVELADFVEKAKKVFYDTNVRAVEVVDGKEQVMFFIGASEDGSEPDEEDNTSRYELIGEEDE